MNKNLARYLTMLIALDLGKARDVSSGACEMMEKAFIDNNFEKVEDYIKNFLKENRTISKIVEDSDEN